jgi:hypothetical protein
MTRELIEFAKQSAPDFTQYNEFFCTLHDFKRFAALVAAAEREACALVAEDVALITDTEDFAIDRCYEIAAAIRARGEQ